MTQEAGTATQWLGQEAPRYTSYPTAHHFSAEVGDEVYGEWLAALAPDAPLSVYVHIPFCRELCWFCGCHTKMTRRYEPVARYVTALLCEMEILQRYTGGKGRLVNLHFGGGSPSLLEPREMSAIFGKLATLFPFAESGERAIELDPRTTLPENIDLYAELGINRVSIGIQDFNEEVQQAINRVQPYALVASVMERLRKVGIGDINCDLIYGLPFQTRERFVATLEQTVSFKPSRISLFSYAHMPQLKKHQRMIDAAWLPSADEKLELYRMAAALLEAEGYVTVGIDHFARADDPLAIAMQNRTLRRNFQGYVTDDAEVLIGLGASSIGQFPEGYAQNNARTPEYIAAMEDGRLATTRGWRFREDDLARKQVIDELMCFLSADIGEICCTFGLPEGYFHRELERLCGKEYCDIVACDGGMVRIITHHRMAARVVAAVFDRYHGQQVSRYSQVA